MRRAGTKKMHTTNTRRNIQRPNTDPPTCCQVVFPVNFQDDNPNFSPTALIMGGVGHSPPYSAGDTHAAPDLTDNVASAPESATPTALEGGNRISNITQPTGVEDQEIPTETDSDVTSVGSFGANDNNSTYLELRTFFLQLKIPLWNSWPSSMKPVISSRSLTKGSTISTP